MFLSIALFLAASGTADPFGAPMIHGDWIAGCDNRGDCRLFSLPVAADGSSEEEGKGIEIAIERAYAINQPLRVEVLLSSIPVDESKSPTMRIDGKTVPLRARWSNNTGVLDQRDALRFVRAMGSARLLEVVVDRKVIGKASVAGLLPLLGYVDREQYRVGTIGALGAPGQKPVDYSVIPPLLPQLSIKSPPRSDEPHIEIAPERLVEILKTDICLQYQDPQDTIKPEVEYVRLDKDNTLALVGSYCGGYNPTLRPYIIDNAGRTRMAQFGPNPLIDPDDPEPYLPGLWWNDREQLLSAFGRARSMGDCGQQTSFAWNGEKFVTVEYSSMPECRGSYNYVTTYKREVVR